jgi:serralysin
MGTATHLTQLVEDRNDTVSLGVPVAGCNDGDAVFPAQADTLPQATGTSASTGGVALNAPLAMNTSAEQALIAGSQWTTHDALGRTVITYSFANASSVYGADANFAATLTPFSAADKSMVQQVLANIAAVCNVSFVEVADNSAQHGEIRYGYSMTPNKMGYAGYSFFPGTAGSGGDVWIGADQAAAKWDWYRPDLLLHETLHAIGLKHPFDGAITLDTASDIIPNTVMSYSTMAGSQVGMLASYPGEPMALDIAALQSLYGAASHNDGDTVYDLGSAQFQSNFHAIWDSSGTDTFDASDVLEGVTLDLREGGRSDVGVAIDATAYFGTGTARTTETTDYTQTITIAEGTTIERAIGSAHDDTIVTGPATQFVEGGAGVDTVMMSGSFNDYSVMGEGASYALTNLATHATTQLEDVERIVFSDAQLQQMSLGTVRADSDYAQALRLYKAALDRIPDQGGVLYWAHALASGATLPQLASGFIASAEFQQRYQSVHTSADFVTLLYQNVLGRAPDAQGLDFWVNTLDHAGGTRPDVLACFSESPENQADTAPLLMGVGAPDLLALV